MTKAILVIDMPKSCAECEVVDYWSRVQEYHCRYLEDRYLKKYNEKPIECPLKSLPIKRGKITLTERTQDIDMLKWALENNLLSKGYNACIDEILGGKNEF